MGEVFRPDEWEDITGAASSIYNPKAADVGSYLRVTAVYTDDLGEEEETVMAVSGFAVESSTITNAAPKFPDQDPTDNIARTDAKIDLRENTAVGANVGSPVVAADPRQRCVAVLPRSGDAGPAGRG